MKATVNQTDLLSAITKASLAVNKKASLPVLHNLLVDVGPGCLSLSGTDLDISISADVPASTTERGATTVPVVKLLDAVKALPKGGDVFVTNSAFSLTLRSSVREFTLPGIDPDEFPEIPGDDPLEKTYVSGTRLLWAVAGTLWSASRDETRTSMSGAYFDDTGTMVTTNTHTMAIANLECRCFDGTIVRREALEKIPKLFDDRIVTCGYDGKWHSFESGAVRMISRTIEGPFPNWKRVVPDLPMESWFEPPGELLEFAGIAKKMGASIRLDLNGALTASFEDYEGLKGKQSFNVQNSGEFKAAYHPEYLINCIKRIGACRMHVDDSLSPAYLEGDGINAVLMPMMLEDEPCSSPSETP